MLTELCDYLHNWFCEDSDKVIDEITLSGAAITSPECDVQTGQYIRIVGSVFNDGVWQYGTDRFRAETFDGAVWLMRVPQTVIDLAEEIDEWQTKYGGIDSAAMSPYNSESFAGYSYSKSNGSVSSDGSAATPTSWQSAFAARLAQWRKL